MKFIVDECVDYTIVRALKLAGYDLTDIRDHFPGVNDSDILKIACKENCLVLTEDKDFGQLIFANGYESSGVIFLRYLHSEREQIIKQLLEFLSENQERLVGSYITVQSGKIRVQKIPTG